MLVYYIAIIVAKFVSAMLLKKNRKKMLEAFLIDAKHAKKAEKEQLVVAVKKVNV